MTDAVDGGVADRGGGRGSYRVIDINAGQILQHAHSTPGFARARAAAERPAEFGRVIIAALRARARRRAAAITAIDADSTCSSRRCGAAPPAGAADFCFSEIVVRDSGRRWSSGGDRRADGGFAGRGGGRASYRVIDINDRPNSAALTWGRLLRSRPGCALNDQQKSGRVYPNRCRLRARARRRAAAITAIDLLDRLEPAGGAAPPAGDVAVFFLAKLLFADSGRRWSSGGDRRC